MIYRTKHWQASFLRSYDSAPRAFLPPPLSRHQLVSLSQSSCLSPGPAYWREGGRGRAWSWIIRPQESLINRSILSALLHTKCLWSFLHVLGGDWPHCGRLYQSWKETEGYSVDSTRYVHIYEFSSLCYPKLYIFLGVILCCNVALKFFGL